MIYFEEWWNLGENCLQSVYNCIIADDKHQTDICISSKEQLDSFIENIANNVYIYSDVEKKYIIQKNTSDLFLNNKMKIDFDNNVLFLFMGTEVKEVLFSRIFQCYLVKFSDKRCESVSYSMALVKKYETDDKTYKFQALNSKPPVLILNRPKNENDDY